MRTILCLLIVGGVFISNCSKKEDSVTENTIQTGTVSDIDGNTYKTVTIGTQTWLAENLKTTKFKDGTAISMVTDNTTWKNLTTPSYCWYNNEGSNKAIYGAIYNWYTVSTSKLCPAGWHVPSDSEWTVLTDFLGGQNTAGIGLKETGTSHWKSPNTGATNQTGFTALPGGYRDGYNGSFLDIGTNGDFYSTNTASSNSGAILRGCRYDSTVFGKGDCSVKDGLSVRCIKD